MYQVTQTIKFPTTLTQESVTQTCNSILSSKPPHTKYMLFNLSNSDGLLFYVAVFYVGAKIVSYPLIKQLTIAGVLSLNH